MNIESRQTIPKFYYYITPLFILLDYLGGLNVRAAVFDTIPKYKNLYYGFCIVCAVGIHLRPQLSAVVALFDSTIIVLMTALSVFMPYVRCLMQADDILNSNLDLASPFSIPKSINIVLSGTIGIIAFYGTIQTLRNSNKRPSSIDSTIPETDEH